MIVESEILRLQESLSRLIGNKLFCPKDSLMLHLDSGISIRGIHIQGINFDGPQVANNLSSIELKKLGDISSITRKRQYYAGRMLSKLSLLDWYPENHISMQDITVENKDDGRPYFTSTDSKVAYAESLSISHKEEYVVVACSTHRNIGLDLEKLTSHDGIVKRVQNTHSIEDIKKINEILGDSIPDLDLGKSCSVIWSALEAGFKAFPANDSKSPIDYKLIIEDDEVLVGNLAKLSTDHKSVYITYAEGHILTLVI